jgi:hypothetical protein
MQSKFSEVTARTFNPMLASELSEEARKAVKAAFDAMSLWRAEMIKSGEKNAEQVIDKMAAAAQALGWPEQVVDNTRAQIESMVKMQTQAMDYIMEAWEEQVKSPATATSSAVLSKLKSMSGAGPIGSWPNMGDLQKAAMNPMQFWVEFASQWQKGWTEAMALWMKAGKSYENAGLRRR